MGGSKFRYLFGGVWLQKEEGKLALARRGEGPREGLVCLVSSEMISQSGRDGGVGGREGSKSWVGSRLRQRSR